MHLSDVLAALQSGDIAPDGILDALRPDGERRALLRAVVPSSFDRDLATTLVLPGTEMEFAALAAHPDVESLPGTQQFRVRPSRRSVLWRQWWSTGDPPDGLPAELADFLGAIAAFAGRTGQLRQRLAAILLLDPAAAGDEFAAEYRRYDLRSDLVSCQDLVDLLNDPDRQQLFTREQREMRGVYQSYLRSRQLFATQWSATTRYVEPDGTIEAYSNLLRAGGTRALDLYARGGRGKTMQLRWLASRRLVPRAELGGLHGGRIPCAIVDFDFVDPVNATRHPWLLLIEIAAQLDPQFAEPVFVSLLTELGWAAPLVRQGAATDERLASAAMRLAELSADDIALTVRRFQQILATRPAESPIVLIFDTIEEIHLRPEGDLRSVVSMLAGLLTSIPALRLILSGRYPIREVLGAAADELPELEQFEVLPFTPDMAHRYLAGRRIPGGPAHDAVIAKADGDPFLLALLADVVQEQPDLSAAEIAEYPADVVYLINRVVRRIPEYDVRWLLRYGVVPRTLTFEFMQSVMAGPLADALTGRTIDDDPATDVRAADPADTPTFANADPPPLSQTWDRLRRYAGTTSWVAADPGGADAVRFRPEVLQPMRTLLRPHPVFQLLHTRAIEYWESMATDRPDRWVDATREAIYHRFQRDASVAVTAWHAALDTAQDDPTALEALAGEILGPDYAGRPGDTTGEILVPREATALAELTLAAALVEQARARHEPSSARIWTDARQRYSSAQTYAFVHVRGEAVVELPEATLAFVGAALDLSDGELDRALALAKESLGAAGNATDRIRARLLLGDIEVARGDATAIDHFRAALAETVEPARRSAIATRIMVTEVAFDNYAQALVICEDSLGSTDDPRDRAALFNYRAVLDLNCGDTERAGSALDQAGRLTGDAWTSKAAEVELARWDPHSALSRLTRPTTDSSADLAERSEISGRIHAALLDRAAAATELQEAQQAWRLAGDADGMTRCLALLAALELRDIGNLRLAARHLEDAGDEAYSRPTGSWLTARLLHADLATRRGDRQAASDIAEQVVERMRETRARPGWRVRSLLGALEFVPDADAPAVLTELAEHLARMTPVEARVQALRAVRADLIAGADPSNWTEVLRLLRDAGDGRHGVDAARSGLVLAEIAVLAGQLDTARSLLLHAGDSLSGARSLFWLRSWCLSADRIAPDLATPAMAQISAFVSEFGDAPLLVEAFLVERAEALLRRDDPAAGDVLDLVAEADRGPANEPTQWAMRRMLARAALGDLGAVRDQPDELGTKLRSQARRMAEQLGMPDDDPLTRWTKPVPPGVTDTGSPDLRLPPPGPEGSQDSDALYANRVAAVLTSERGVVRVTAQPAAATGPPVSQTLPVGEDRADAVTALDFEAFWWLDRFRYADPTDPIPAVRRSLEQSPVRPQIRVSSKDPSLHGYPWEDILGGDVVRIAAEPDARADEVAFLQTALGVWQNRSQTVGRGEPRTAGSAMSDDLLRDRGMTIDGRLGPASRVALTEFQRDQGLPADGQLSEPLLDRLQRVLAAGAPAPTVLIVEPSGSDHVVAQSSSADQGTDLADLYQRVGFRTNRLAPLSPPDLASVIRASLGTEAPSVIHLAGTMRSSHGRLSLAVGPPAWMHDAYGGSEIYDYAATDIDSLLRLFFARATPPLVVLDVDAPPTGSELVLQLFERNAFAADLFALGGARAVLATGLVGSISDNASRYYQTPSAPALVDAMSTGGPLLEIARMVHEIERQMPGRPPTALFTHLPWYRPVPG